MTPVKLVRLLAGCLAVPLLLSLPRRPAATIRVFAAASLTESFRDIERQFVALNPGTSVVFNFAGSQQIALQLEQGARADVFASADGRWMTYLRERSLLEGEPSVFARNRLVVIYPRANPAGLRGLADLATKGVKLVLAADAVPVGRYSRDLLRNLNGVNGLPADFATRVGANVVSNEENVKGVLAKVQLGEADAGVVYRSDISADVAPVVSMIEIPDQQNVLASYPIALLKGSANPDRARRFVAFVRSPTGQRILQRHGFQPIDARP